MRLVGATNGYIRRPFVLEGVMMGILGGALAAAMCWGVFAAFRGSMGEVRGTLVFFGTTEIALIILFGTSIGYFGSLVSVGRHLRHV